MKLTLLGQTGNPIDLEDAFITFDRKVGFTIEEGKLIHHNGIVTCRAEYGGHVQEEGFHLVFSFAPPVVGLTTPEITTGSKRFVRQDEGAAVGGWNKGKGPFIKGSNRQRNRNNPLNIFATWHPLLFFNLIQGWAKEWSLGCV